MLLHAATALHPALRPPGGRPARCAATPARNERRSNPRAAGMLEDLPGHDGMNEPHPHPHGRGLRHGARRGTRKLRPLRDRRSLRAACAEGLAERSAEGTQEPQECWRIRVNRGAGAAQVCGCDRSEPRYRPTTDVGTLFVARLPVVDWAEHLAHRPVPGGRLASGPPGDRTLAHRDAEMRHHAPLMRHPAACCSGFFECENLLA
jgi:hypothetical protein